MLTGDKIRILSAIVDKGGIGKGAEAAGVSRQYASGICAEFLKILNLDEVMSVKHSITNGQMKFHLDRVKKDIVDLNESLLRLEYFLSDSVLKKADKIAKKLNYE